MISYFYTRGNLKSIHLLLTLAKTLKFFACLWVALILEVIFYSRNNWKSKFAKKCNQCSKTLEILTVVHGDYFLSQGSSKRVKKTPMTNHALDVPARHQLITLRNEENNVDDSSNYHKISYWWYRSMISNFNGCFGHMTRVNIVCSQIVKSWPKEQWNEYRSSAVE